MRERERRVCLRRHGTCVVGFGRLRHHGALVALVVSSAPSRHILRVLTRCSYSSSFSQLFDLRHHGTSLDLRRHGALILPFAGIVHLFPGPITRCSYSIFSQFFLRHHGTFRRLLCRLRHPGTYSAPSRHNSGPNTMLLLRLLPIVPAPSRHILSSAPSRHTFVVVCAITAQVSSSNLSPDLPAGP